MKHIKLLTTMSYFTLILSFLFISLVAYWLLYPYNPITFKSPYKINTNVVSQGDTLRYTFEYCKHSSQLPEVKREFVDGIIFVSTDSRANVRVGCGTAISQVYVPDTLPPGEYTLRITVKYQVNPLRVISYIRETNQFKVTERSE